MWHSISPQWLLWGAIQATGLIVCNAFTHYQMKTLKRKGYSQRQAIPWLKALSIAATFEFAAFAVAATMYHK